MDLLQPREFPKVWGRPAAEAGTCPRNLPLPLPRPVAAPGGTTPAQAGTAQSFCIDNTGHVEIYHVYQLSIQCSLALQIRDQVSHINRTRIPRWKSSTAWCLTTQFLALPQHVLILAITKKK